TTCNQTSATPTAGATGGLAPYTFAWSGGLTDNTPFVANANGTYTATATDANGCSATSTAALTVTAASGIIAPVTSNHSQDHGDDFDINYYDASCDLIATVDDGMGGNVLGSTTATVNVEATAGVHNGQPFVRRWYQITPTSNGSADVILYINQSDFDDYNTVVAAPYLALPTGPADVTGIANIRITKNDDGGLGNNPIVITPSVNWNGTYWELSFNTPSFSQFRVHSVNAGNVPLPATVISFTGEKQTSSDLLSWTTASEQNNAYFNLQHSTDGITFNTLAQVNSKGLNGNSQVRLEYQAENAKPQLGHNYYRLEQVDIDGRVSVHAKVIDLIWGADGSSVNIYPNPTTDVLNVDLYAPTAQNTSVKVLDMSGRVVKQIDAKSQAGANHIQLSLGEIASGVYTVQVYSNNKLSFTSKVRKND
ncbi:MAG TPA: T9SS type A sorting domain-containing protein, partial [Thermodesulfobacteriota bacterium]|nr:T9SS type A sorting domain-containing protein [Thermodesulfobacteriota bacterium]